MNGSIDRSGNVSNAYRVRKCCASNTYGVTVGGIHQSSGSFVHYVYYLEKADGKAPLAAYPGGEPGEPGSHTMTKHEIHLLETLETSHA